ncbi:hypothetical protein ACQ4PT_012310 [Festuca glaucescens]
MAKKAASRAFVAALSDIDTSSSEEESSEEGDPQAKNKKKAKVFTGICSMADDNNNNNSDTELDPSKVTPSYDQLSVQVDNLNDALISQDRLLKKAIRELKELRPKYESVSTELACLRSKSVDEECKSCALVMSELAELKNMHAQVASRLENAEKKLIEEESRPTLLGACKSCSLLAKDVEMKDKHLKELESRLESASSSKDVQPNCAICITLQEKLSWVRAQKLLGENEYLLSLAEKCSEGKGKMNLILVKTKMCADKAEKAKAEATPQPIKKPIPQTKKNPAPQPKRAAQPKMRELATGRGLENKWLIDSSCSRHMTRDSSWFSSLTPMKRNEYITFRDDRK